MAHNREQPTEWSADEVTEALQERTDRGAEEARQAADRLSELFADETTIEDDEIEKDERAFLWSMMLDGFVTVETEKRPHPDHGRTWRYFYWHLVPPDRLAKREAEEEGEDTVYDELPADAWRRGASAA